MTQQKEDVATFSTLAKDAGFSRSKIMHWEKMGLFTATFTLMTGTKIFDRKETVKRLKEIVKLQKAGRSLEEIKEILV